MDMVFNTSSIHRSHLQARRIRATGTQEELQFRSFSARSWLAHQAQRTLLQYLPRVLKVRWGKLLHCVFLFFALATNLLVSSQLVVGGSAVANTLTGIPTLAAIWLIPLGVACYVLVGGMRATLLADYTHTVGLLIIIFFFFFKVWVTSPEIGSASAMVKLLERSNDIHNNASSSPLTFRSLDGLVFE